MSSFVVESGVVRIFFIPIAPGGWETFEKENLSTKEERKGAVRAGQPPRQPP